MNTHKKAPENRKNKKTSVNTAKHSTFALQPFGFIVNVITTEGDWSAALNTILRKHGISERIEIKPNSAGYFYHSHERNRIYMVFPTKTTADSILHELTHIIISVSDLTGTNINLHTTEMIAYTLQSAFRGLTQCLKKMGTKITI